MATIANCKFDFSGPPGIASKESHSLVSSLLLLPGLNLNFLLYPHYMPLFRGMSRWAPEWPRHIENAPKQNSVDQL